MMSLQYNQLTGLTCSKAPGFWMVEHQLVHGQVMFKLKAHLLPQLHITSNHKLIIFPDHFVHH